MALNMKIPGLSAKNRARGQEDQGQLDSADMSVGIARAMKHVQKEIPTTQREAKAAIKDALIVIEKAIMGIDAVKDILRQARDIAETAKTSIKNGPVEALAEDFEGLCDKLDHVVSKCQEGDKNLIAGEETKLLVPLSDARHSNFVVQSSNLTRAGLGLPLAKEAFDAEDTILEILTEVDRALDLVEHTGSIYCSNAAVLARHFGSL